MVLTLLGGSWALITPILSLLITYLGDLGAYRYSYNTSKSTYNLLTT